MPIELLYSIPQIINSSYANKQKKIKKTKTFQKINFSILSISQQLRAKIIPLEKNHLVLLNISKGLIIIMNFLEIKTLIKSREKLYNCLKKVVFLPSMHLMPSKL